MGIEIKQENDLRKRKLNEKFFFKYSNWKTK